MMIGLIAIPKLAALLAGGCPALTEIAAPNEAGVSMGHVHLIVGGHGGGEEVLGDARRRAATTFGPFAMIKFPGALVLLKQAEPAGAAAGSVVDHVCFQVPNLAKALAVWQAAGIKTEPGRIPEQAYVITPDELLRVEVTEMPSLTVPIAFHHVHFFVGENGPGGANAVAEMQAWYARMFGAKPGKRMHFDAADLPGANLTFSNSAVPDRGDGWPRDRSHQLGGCRPAGILQQARGRRREVRRAVHRAARSGHPLRLPHRPLGHQDRMHARRARPVTENFPG